MKRALAFFTAIVLMFSCLIALAEETYDVYIICNPKTSVNVRSGRSKKSIKIGMMDCGMELETDGIVKDGWLHIVNSNLESPDGWIRKGNTTTVKPEVYEKPVVYEVIAYKRVAARKSVDGEFIRWLKAGTRVKVYSIADWAVTDKGYVQSEFLEACWGD